MPGRLVSGMVSNTYGNESALRPPQHADTVFIMEEGNLPFPRCPHCDMLLLWLALSIFHLNTTQCAEGLDRKRFRVAAEEDRVGTEMVFREYGPRSPTWWPLNTSWASSRPRMMTVQRLWPTSGRTGKSRRGCQGYLDRRGDISGLRGTFSRRPCRHSSYFSRRCGWLLLVSAGHWGGSNTGWTTI